MLIGQVLHGGKIMVSKLVKKNQIAIYDTDIVKVIETGDLPSKDHFLTVPTSEVAFLPPTIPTKIVGVGRNYVGHARELNHEIPQEPLIFLKPPSCMIGHEGTVIYPDETRLLHYEGEIAIVIRKKLKDATSSEIENNLAEYLGYTAFLDITARDLQKSDKTWARAKGFDTFGPIGPWIKLDDFPFEITLKTTLNGETRQQDSSKNMIFSIPTLVEYISHVMTLEPGDVIATGTPEGVGELSVGDILEVEVSGVPSLKVTIKKSLAN